MSKSRRCKESQTKKSQEEQWYDMVVAAGPDMEEYFHKILACQYARILPNDCTLLPKLEGSNRFILVEKLHSKLFFCPEWGEQATMENLSKDSDKACLSKHQEMGSTPGTKVMKLQPMVQMISFVRFN